MQYNINTNNTQDANNMEENTMANVQNNAKNTKNTKNMEENTMKVITEANEIMEVFAEMCEANCRYAEDNERDEPYGTFTFGINGSTVDVCAETTFMIGLGVALEMLTCRSERPLVDTTIKLDDLDRKGRKSVDVYDFIAWLYTRCTCGAPTRMLVFTGGQYTIVIKDDPERIRTALIQMCIKVADEHGCRSVMQFIAQYSNIYKSMQLDDHYSVLYAVFKIDTFQLFENMPIPCGIFSIADNNMEECQYNLFKAIEDVHNWHEHLEVYKSAVIREENAYIFNNTKYAYKYVGGAENYVVAYDSNDKPVRCMFFATWSTDASEIDKCIRIEIANDYVRQLKQIIPEELLDDMPRLPEMLLMFECLCKNASYKAPEKWEVYAANKALKNMLNTVYNIWRMAVPESDNEDSLEEFNDRYVCITTTNGASACLPTTPALCEDLIDLARHLYEEL